MQSSYQQSDRPAVEAFRTRVEPILDIPDRLPIVAWTSIILIAAWGAGRSVSGGQS